jgi:hypothetical protein
VGKTVLLTCSEFGELFEKEEREFNAVIANYARSTFSDEDVVRFAKAVVARSG